MGKVSKETRREQRYNANLHKNSIDEICVPVIKKILGHYLELNPNYNGGISTANQSKTKNKRYRNSKN